MGLDPRAFAFDPLNPGASLTARAMVQTATRADADADAAEPLDVSVGSALSGDGPQDSYVGAAAVSGKKRDGAARLRADAFNADAAGSDVEDAEDAKDAEDGGGTTEVAAKEEVALHDDRTMQ